MTTQTKAVIHGVLSVVANAGILAAVPDTYKVWVLLAWNLIQVLVAFFDPTYAYQNLGAKQNK